MSILEFTCIFDKLVGHLRVHGANFSLWQETTRRILGGEYVQEDTIAAIATASGEASIAVIRVSGATSVGVVDLIFSGRRSLIAMASHTVQYGHILTLQDRAILDEVVVTVMKGPRTYTTEDVVEISTHGGRQSVQAVLTEVLRAGARLALPGEFTKRAFLGGRIDLTQAEGVMELIQAHSQSARAVALRQVEGSLTERITELRQQLLSTLAIVEVTIDYPEHDEEEATAMMVADHSRVLIGALSDLLRSSESGRILRDGLRTVIVGKPNVGKSSLLNQLARIDRAIVTDIPGTTRDVLEEWLQIGGIPLRIADTAGVRVTDDPIEQIGVLRSRQALQSAELVLIVLDASKELSDTDSELIALTMTTPRIFLLNKVDLAVRTDVEDVRALVGDSTIIAYSVTMQKGLEQLEQAIAERVYAGQKDAKDTTFLANARHISLLEQAVIALERAVQAAMSGMTLDLLAADLLQAWTLLGEIIGETPREDLLDQIFTQFCLGK